MKSSTLALALGAAAGCNGPAPTGPAAPSEASVQAVAVAPLPTLGPSLEVLREQFNSEADRLRFLALLSPS